MIKYMHAQNAPHQLFIDFIILKILLRKFQTLFIQSIYNEFF